MAGRKKAFFCSLCDIGFDYESKYLRHTGTVGHMRFANLLSNEANEEDCCECQYKDGVRYFCVCV